MARQRVLVVEDDRNLSDTLRFNLERSGYEVVTAADGPSAIELAGRERPDLILMDLMLPVMSGFAVCEEIRRESTVPIIAMTARTDAADCQRAFDAGAEGLPELTGLSAVSRPTVHEMGEKIDSESKARLDSAVERLKGAVQRNDTDEIRSASEALSQIWNEVSSKLYQQASAGGGQGGPGPGAPGDGASQAAPQGGEGEGKKRGPDDEIEADYEVVK